MCIFYYLFVELESEISQSPFKIVFIELIIRISVHIFKTVKKSSESIFALLDKNVSDLINQTRGSFSLI